MGNLYPLLIAPIGYGFILTLKYEAAVTWMKKEEISYFVISLHGIDLLGALIGSSIEFMFNKFDAYDFGYFLFFSLLVALCYASYVVIWFFQAPLFPPENNMTIPQPYQEQIKACFKT